MSSFVYNGIKQELAIERAKVEDLTSQMTVLTLENTGLVNELEVVKNAFPVQSFSNPKVIRCVIQPVIRLLSALLTLTHGKLLREEFVEKIEEIMDVDLTGYKLPEVITTVTSYTTLCAVIKARHFKKNNIFERKGITSSAIEASEFAFVLARFQGWLCDVGLEEHFGLVSVIYNELMKSVVVEHLPVIKLVEWC